MAIAPTPSSLPDPTERRLQAFGLSTELIHAAMLPGLRRAYGRTHLALNTTPGTDIYHDGMEQFAVLLTGSGWRPVTVDHQPRLLHPEGKISFTLASATGVANSDFRQHPRTGRKGAATRSSLTPQPLPDSLFDIAESRKQKETEDAGRLVPLWFLLSERTPEGLNLEFSKPLTMSDSGTVNAWAERLAIRPLKLDDDLAVFNPPDDDGIDVPVTPR